MCYNYTLLHFLPVSLTSVPQSLIFIPVKLNMASTLTKVHRQINQINFTAPHISIFRHKTLSALVFCFVLDDIIYFSFNMRNLHVVVEDCSLLCPSPTSLLYNLHSAPVGLLYSHIWCCQRELRRHSLCMLAFLSPYTVGTGEIHRNMWDTIWSTNMWFTVKWKKGISHL